MSLDEPEPFFKDYKEAISGLKLAQDPFPNVPPEIVDYWADNKELLSELKDMLLDSLLFATSNIYLFWGAKGVGKTFAAKYLCNSKNQIEFFKELPNHMMKEQKIITFKAPQPRRTGELTSSVYRNIASNFLNMILYDEDLRKEISGIIGEIENLNIRKAFSSLNSSLRVFLLGGDINKVRYDDNDGYKYMLDEKNKIGKIRDLNECGEILTWLFKIIIEKYSRITIIIDELENLARSSISERYQFNDLLRTIYGNMSTGLNLILVYTFETSGDMLSTLQPAFQSRIARTIPFKMVDNEANLIEYVEDCIRMRGKIEPSSLIDPEALRSFARRILEKYNEITFRDINKEIHKLIAGCYRIKLEEGDFDNTTLRITQDLFGIYTQFIR